VDEDALVRVARVLDGRLVLVEATGNSGGKSKIVLSRPALVIGQKTIMTIAPRLKQVLSLQGSSVWIAADDGGGNLRRIQARLIRTDDQTGLSVLRADDLQGKVLNFHPAPAPPSKDTPVILVEPGANGQFNLRGGKVIQNRAYIEQGKGQNPLLVIRLKQVTGDTPLYSHAGAVLSDTRGRFIGVVTPPVLESGKQQEFKLQGGEVLALPAEIAQLISDSLARGEDPVRGYFGASFREVPNPPREVSRGKRAVRVEKVTQGGPADQGGLRKGDWLLAIERKRPITYSDIIHFSELVEYGGVGKTVRLGVARSGETRFRKIPLRIQIGLK